MKRLVILASILSMLGTSMAFAQGSPYQPRPQAQQHKPNSQQGRPQQSRPQSGKPHGQAQPAPHHSQWSKGKRLPPSYRHDVVRDYGRHRLAPPPRGYNWVRVNNEYLLIGIASGIISSIARTY